MAFPYQESHLPSCRERKRQSFIQGKWSLLIWFRHVRVRRRQIRCINLRQHVVSRTARVTNPLCDVENVPITLNTIRRLSRASGTVGGFRNFTSLQLSASELNSASSISRVNQELYGPHSLPLTSPSRAPSHDLDLQNGLAECGDVQVTDRGRITVVLAA